jgi:hypothetical protein
VKEDMADEEQKNREQQRKEYLDELKYLHDGERDANQTLDKALLTLTGAAFGLSIAISRELVPASSRPQAQWLLFVSWLAFTLSLIATLVSLHTSVRSWHREQEYLNKSYNTGTEAPRNVSSTLTDLLNTTSLVCCLAGIVTFATYVWINLPK